jgi:hypothetical protein
MPPPKFKPSRTGGPTLEGEAAKAFSSLSQKLEARTGPLSPEAAAFIKNLSEDEAVALDNLIEGGAKLGEVEGLGLDAVEGPVWPAANPFSYEDPSGRRAAVKPGLRGPAATNVFEGIYSHRYAVHNPSQYADYRQNAEARTAAACQRQ